MKPATHARGFSLIELLIVVAIILVISAIAIPNLLQSKKRANESAAVAHMRSIAMAQAIYQVSCGGMSMTMAALGPGATNDCTSKSILDGISATSPLNKAGYVYTFAAGAAAGPASDGTAVSISAQYDYKGEPLVGGNTGDRAYYTNELMRLYQTNAGVYTTAGRADIGSALLMLQ